MANKTPNLLLILPQFGEYKNTWHIPANKNFELIDQAIGDLQTEAADARGTEASINDRLDVALNADGTLKPVPEVLDARNSTIHGYSDGTTEYDLDERIEVGEREVWSARQSLDSLLDSLAFQQDENVPNSILSAPVGFLSFTGANVRVDGSVTPIVCNINGYRQVVRSLKTTTVTGGAGTRYVYLQRDPAGEIILDRTGVGDDTGSTGEYPLSSGWYGKLTDVTQNFVSLGVQPGDILEVTSVASVNRGKWVVKSVLSAQELEIVGSFVSIQTNLNYKITNPIAPSLQVTATAHSRTYVRENGLIYVGRAVFDGANVTSVTPYALKGKYQDFSSVTPIGGNFALTISHNLGYVPSKISVYGSQAGDYSAAIEPLSISEAAGGSTLLQRSVIVSADDMTIQIKNATNGVFYRDYSGSTQTAGFILVVVER